MGRVLLILGWIALLAILLNGVLGFQIGEYREGMVQHLLLGLGGSLLLLFSHCWIMFYLIGTGKAIKEAVAEHGLEQELIERTKEFKNKSYPPLMLAMGVAMATFILGGGVSTGVIPAWLHQGLFYATLVTQYRALRIEGRVLGENDDLMRSINQRLAAGEHAA